MGATGAVASAIAARKFSDHERRRRHDVVGFSKHKNWFSMKPAVAPAPWNSKSAPKSPQTL
jgi:hypothetical protein